MVRMRATKFDDFWKWICINIPNQRHGARLENHKRYFLTPPYSGTILLQQDRIWQGRAPVFCKTLRGKISSLLGLGQPLKLPDIHC